MGLVHPPLRGARRRRDPRLLLGDRRPAPVRPPGRGRLDRRLRHGPRRPWTIANLRFDESLGQIHGYDFDFCMQARAAGKKVVTADLQVIHHHSLRLLEDPESWITAYMRTREKWEDQLPPQRLARRRLGMAGAPRRGRGRRGPAHGRRGGAPAHRATTSSSRRCGTASSSWRLTAPLPAAPSARRLASSSAATNRRDAADRRPRECCSASERRDPGRPRSRSFDARRSRRRVIL